MAPSLSASPPARPRFRTFSQECRQRYGQPLGKIPLDLGLLCPNRARGGCVFCRPASFTPRCLRAGDSLAEQIQRGKTLLLRGRFRAFLGYIQQETATALPTDQLLPHLAQVLADPDCRGLILSTRPDAIADDLPGALSALAGETGKTCLVELGVQSSHDRSLTWLNRNHSFADVLNAVSRLRDRDGLALGAHLILGIPGETEADMRATIQTVCALPVSALKLHHLQVIAATPLAVQYQLGEVPVFSLNGYLDLLCRLLPHIPSTITLHRLWATSHPDLLIAPRWDCLTSNLSRRLQQRMAELDLWQGQALDV